MSQEPNAKNMFLVSVIIGSAVVASIASTAYSQSSSGGGQPPNMQAVQAAFQKIKDCFQADKVQLPSSPQNGQPPSLTDAQKAEFKKCRSQETANAISSQSGSCGADGSACGNSYQTQTTETGNASGSGYSAGVGE